MSAKVKKPSPSSEKKIPKVLSLLGYQFGKILGKGTYSKVCVAVNPEGVKFACKIINKKMAGSDFIRKFLPRELQIISRIKHPNIVTVYKILEINDTIYIFMDYCRNGDLLEYIRNTGSIPEGKCKYFFRQIVAAIQYLHGLEIAHRDLKCENVLMMWNNQIKIGDFGFARGCKSTDGLPVLSETFCGSAAYAAPEILQGIAYQPKLYDMWALGCILYIMLLATMPFDDSNIKKMLKLQISRSVCMTAAANWIDSDALKCLISSLLEPDTSKRITIDQVADCQWFKEGFHKKKNLVTTIFDSYLV